MSGSAVAMKWRSRHRLIGVRTPLRLAQLFKPNACQQWREPLEGSEASFGRRSASRGVAASVHCSAADVRPGMGVMQPARAPRFNRRLQSSIERRAPANPPRRRCASGARRPTRWRWSTPPAPAARGHEIGIFQKQRDPPRGTAKVRFTQHPVPPRNRVLLSNTAKADASCALVTGQITYS